MSEREQRDKKLTSIPTRSFANRATSAFITPDEVERLELWSGKAVCEALVGLEIPTEVRRHLVEAFVWSSLTLTSQRLHGSGVWDAASA